jgi:hypothetical protein
MEGFCQALEAELGFFTPACPQGQPGEAETKRQVLCAEILHSQEGFPGPFQVFQVVLEKIGISPPGAGVFGRLFKGGPEEFSCSFEVVI